MTSGNDRKATELALDPASGVALAAAVTAGGGLG